MRWPVLAIVSVSCGSTHSIATTSSVGITTSASGETRASEVVASCPDAAILVENGVERGAICASDAAAKGLTVLELSDAWTPSLISGTPYRATYAALAEERSLDGKPLEGEDGLQELYGVVPSLAIVRARLDDDARHACHDKLDRAAIAKLDRPFSQDDRDAVKLADQIRVVLEGQIERALPAIDPGKLARWGKLDEQHAGLVAAERHYACDGYLAEKDADGSFTWRAGNATELFQRRNFLMPNERLDAETREALALDSRELDFRLALRVLRERVIDATGLIEDGTAGTGPQPVLGRMLDPLAMRAARGAQVALPDGAPDLIGAATEAAATQLGWTDAAAARAFLDRHKNTRMAIALPAAPAYHKAHMDLATEIDRGDVWYDEQPIPRRVVHRPNMVLYVRDGGTKRALVRWPTTIGGWAEVRMPDGQVVSKWKESDVGPRVWKDLYAGPTWLAPKTTPDRDLVKNLYNGHWALKKEIFGPGPHAAFGMALLMHYQVVPQKDGTVRYDDDGIGTHGSSSVTSIVNGTSHGCHRLYNQLAVRLADFLLRHRDHVVKGDQPEQYRRIVSHNGTFLVKVDTRGFLYELTPPVPVDVQKGNILSERKYPPRDSAPARP